MLFRVVMATAEYILNIIGGGDPIFKARLKLTAVIFQVSPCVQY